MTKQFTPKQLTVIDAVLVTPAPVDFPRVQAVLVRMTLTGFVQLAKAQARVYLANLRAIEGSAHAVYTEAEANAVIDMLEFDRDEKGNNLLTIRNTLRYGSSDPKTVKRLKDAVASGACADVDTAIAQGRGKPPTNESAKSSPAYLVRANGERIALTDAQYASVLAVLKLNVAAPF